VEGVSRALPHPGERAVNHVLKSAPRAMERLRPHAGRTVAFRSGPLAMALTIQTTGEVVAAVEGAVPDLEVRVSPFLVPRLAAGEEAAYDAIEMQGDEKLAADVAFLARHLRWDYEEDLAKVVGDIAAHRIAGTARDLGRWSREASLRLAQGAAEYWTEEAPLIASRTRVASFARDVAGLAEAVERLEQRIEQLSARK
jgi:ubiquinone biosynthesis protein UbiJ